MIKDITDTGIMRKEDLLQMDSIKGMRLGEIITIRIRKDKIMVKFLRIIKLKKISQLKMLVNNLKRDQKNQMQL
jgi:hypothetical protein